MSDRKWHLNAKSLAGNLRDTFSDVKSTIQENAMVKDVMDKGQKTWDAHLAPRVNQVVGRGQGSSSGVNLVNMTDKLKNVIYGSIPTNDDERVQSGATFPARENNFMEWFVDGRGFMEHAANLIELAHEEIFMTDWWLSPEVYMKRPATEHDPWRLDLLLKRKAMEGVRIYVMLYKEIEFALGLKSLDSKRKLHSLHPNIRVLRHPDMINRVFLWSHHEKIIVIDQNMAFVGGLDVAYGRWDDPRHKLVDLGPVKPHATQSRAGHHRSSKSSLESGMRSMAQMLPTLVPSGETDASQPTTQQATPVAPPRTQKAKTPRAPHPIGFKEDSNSSSDSDTNDSPTETYHTQSVRYAEGQPLGGEARDWDRMSTKSLPPERPQFPVGVFGKAVERFKATRQQKQREEPVLTQSQSVLEKNYQLGFEYLVGEKADIGDDEKQLWIGKDYVNFIYKNFTELNKPAEDFIDRGQTPRMPWHDVHSVVYGDAARDVAKHFIQRWNAIKMEKRKIKKNMSYPFLMPKTDAVIVPRILRDRASPCNVQVLRSISSWTLPELGCIEASIQEAYCTLIEAAQHFIYIENQFFVSMVNSTDVENRICRTLLDRIVRAHRNGEKFRVYVVIPLLPNFEGELGAASGSQLQAIMKWTYGSILRGSSSLFHNLVEKGVSDPGQYVTFNSLRTYDNLGGLPVTELIYIHSKLMIVDDRCCIIGSANINDRSLLGNRDSEIALYIEDQEMVPSTLDGRQCVVGKFCAGFRREIFAEHLGLLPQQKYGNRSAIDVTDPVSDRFYRDVWNRVAADNTRIMSKVFNCTPTDDVLSFDDLAAYTAQIPMAQYSRKEAFEALAQVQGHLVRFPLLFLSYDDLAPSVATKEGLAPPIIFT